MVREGRATTWSFTRSCETHSSRVACPSSSASTTCRRPGSSTAGPTPSQACARARTGIDGRACEWWKKHYVSGLARSRPLTDLRRWPGDGFFRQNTEVGIPTSRGKTTRIFLPGKTHLHVVLLPFLCSFPELALDHGFRQE